MFGPDLGKLDKFYSPNFEGGAFLRIGGIPRFSVVPLVMVLLKAATIRPLMMLIPQPIVLLTCTLNAIIFDHRFFPHYKFHLGILRAISLQVGRGGGDCWSARTNPRNWMAFDLVGFTALSDRVLKRQPNNGCGRTEP
jgi:hypothetical protein